MPDSADNVKALAAKATAANFALVEKALAGKDWVFGTWSAADAYIFVFYNWATKLGLDMSACPNYGKHFERMQQRPAVRSEEHTSELQSLMRISYAVFCLKKKTERIKKISNTSNKIPHTTNNN